MEATPVSPRMPISYAEPYYLALPLHKPETELPDLEMEDNLALARMEVWTWPSPSPSSTQMLRPQYLDELDDSEESRRQCGEEAACLTVLTPHPPSQDVPTLMDISVMHGFGLQGLEEVEDFDHSFKRTIKQASQFLGSRQHPAASSGLGYFHYKSIQPHLYAAADLVKGRAKALHQPYTQCEVLSWQHIVAIINDNLSRREFLVQPLAQLKADLYLSIRLTLGPSESSICAFLEHTLASQPCTPANDLRDLIDYLVHHASQSFSNLEKVHSMPLVLALMDKDLSEYANAVISFFEHHDLMSMEWMHLTYAHAMWKAKLLELGL